MSSTNRGASRALQDYYVTPIDHVERFLLAFLVEHPWAFRGVILDPSAGGDDERPMSYPTALQNIGVSPDCIRTIDIRLDSHAEVKGDYLETELDYQPDVIITNPPFYLSVPFVEKALRDVSPGGMVIMLQRLNWLGSRTRLDFWQRQMANEIWVDHIRMDFRPWLDKRGVDSIEYGHFVWRSAAPNDSATLRVY